jgi:hypothetical protein
VVGLRHPLKHLRGKAIQSLRNEGIQVDVVGEDLHSKLFKVFSWIILFFVLISCNILISSSSSC